MRFFLACLCLISALPMWGSVARNPQRVALKDGAVMPLENGRLLCELNVKSASPDWEKFESYEYRVVRGFEEMNGFPVMTMRNAANKKHDTAWNLLSREIPLPASAGRLLLEIDFHAGVRWNVPNPEKSPFRNCVLWYDGNKKQIRKTDISYQGFFEGFTLTQIPLEVPKGASSFRIQFGVDFPDIHNKQYIAYRGVRVLAAAAPAAAGRSSFDSQTFKASSGKISWTGDFPDKSFGTLQLAWAPDVDGAPGKWSEFIGPDGTAKSVYQNNSAIRNIPGDARYLRYRFTFHFRDKRPSLRSVTVGDFQDKEWSTVFAQTAPYVVNMTPAGRNFSKPVAVKFKPDTLIDWKTLKFSIDGRDVTGSVVIAGNTVKYIPQAPFEDKLHSFEVNVSDIEGNQTSVRRYFDFVDLPEKNVISLRDDGMILIDGKPFFPIGIYSMAKKPWNNNSFYQGVQDLREAGFNLTHNYISVRNSNFNEFLDAARKNGIKVFIAGSPNGANCKNMDQIVNTIRKERNNPDILAWYLADDSSSHWSPEELAEMSDAVRAVDPSRITAQADGVGGYSSFANSTDVFLPEIYPGLDEKSELDSGCVPYVIMKVKGSFERIELEGRPRVSVWAIISFFRGWGINRYATLRELRAMSYAAIIYGAQGITWYTYSAGDHTRNFGASQFPESWKVITTLTKELNAMIPVFCERKAAQQPEITILSGPEKDALNNPSIAGLLKIHDGKSYYMTVNSADAAVKASFAIPGVKAGKVLFENRDVELQDGKLTDTFAPYDVHIYELQ